MLLGLQRVEVSTTRPVRLFSEEGWATCFQLGCSRYRVDRLVHEEKRRSKLSNHGHDGDSAETRRIRLMFTSLPCTEFRHSFLTNA